MHYVSASGFVYRLPVCNNTIMLPPRRPAYTRRGVFYQYSESNYRNKCIVSVWAYSVWKESRFPFLCSVQSMLVNCKNAVVCTHTVLMLSLIHI